MVEGRLRRAGFRVSSRRLEYTGIDGLKVTEERVTGYSVEGDMKVTYSRFSDGRTRLSVVVTGRRATRALRDKLEGLGASVDFDEGERLYAVFKNVDEKRAGEIVDEVSSRRP